MSKRAMYLTAFCVAAFLITIVNVALERAPTRDLVLFPACVVWIVACDAWRDRKAGRK